MTSITVAIPVRNGGALLGEVLDAVSRQRLGEEDTVEVLVCDSGSNDESVAIARTRGAEVFSIHPREYSHGGTRNLMMARAQGTHVALLTQDSVPADDFWLSRLLSSLREVDGAGLAYGPYQARPEASPMVRRELDDWFASLAPGGFRRVDRLAESERSIPDREFLGARGFFTSANGLVVKEAWREVPFRPVPYAEDHVLARDMLRAGFAKVFVPDAPVVHSHDYSLLGWLRRSFDESRAMQEVYGAREQAGTKALVLRIRGSVAADWRWSARRGEASPVLLGRSMLHHGSRALGAFLGARAASLPAPVVRGLSLEARE